MTKVAAALVSLIVLFASNASAQGTEGPEGAASHSLVDSNTPESRAARDLVTRYLMAVKAKKWPEAKKFLHPKTIEAIAERKRRLGKEDHPMAPWFREKADSWLKQFKVLAAQPAPLGSFVVETSEDHFQVQEKALAEGEKATYLIGLLGGKWFVVDKKRGETFTPASVKLGYSGWFDTRDSGEPVEGAPAPE